MLELEPPNFQLVEFVGRGRPAATKMVDVVPSTWITFNKKKGKCEVQYPPPPYERDEVRQELHDFVENRRSPIETWPSYTIKFRGDASTYDEAVTKVNKLAREKHAFSLQSDEDLSVKEKQAEDRVKKRRLQQQSHVLNEAIKNAPKLHINVDNKAYRARQDKPATTTENQDEPSSLPEQLMEDTNLSDSLSSEEVSQEISNEEKLAKKLTEFEDSINEEPETIIHHNIAQSSAGTSFDRNIAGPETLFDRFSESNARTSIVHISQLNPGNPSIDPSFGRNIAQSSAGISFDHISESNELKVIEMEAIKNSHTVTLNTPIIRMEDITYDQNTLTRLSVTVEDIKKTNNDMFTRILNNQSAMLQLLMGGQSSDFNHNPIDNLRHHDIHIPILSYEQFVTFLDILTTQPSVRKDVCSLLNSCVDKDNSISRSIVNMLKTFLHKELAIMFTASKETATKRKFKDTALFDCISGVITSRRRAFNIDTPEKDINRGLSAVLTNVYKWNNV